jgi:hypothetical protein
MERDGCATLDVAPKRGRSSGIRGLLGVIQGVARQELSNLQHSALDRAHNAANEKQRGNNMADINKHLDKAFEGKEFDELTEAPIDALEGLSKPDAEALYKALNIKTIRDLAENKFVLRAQAIVNLARAGKKATTKAA